MGARQIIKKPKTPAGVRTIALPMWLLPELEQHISDYSEQTADGRVFVGPTCVTPARPNFSPVWARTLAKAGMTGVHFHDLRPAGNHFAAVSGASTRELMGRMRHVSVNAALVYQHRTASRDRAIADSLDAIVAALKDDGSDDSGTLGARRLDSDDLRLQPSSLHLSVARALDVGADDENRTRILSAGT